MDLPDEQATFPSSQLRLVSCILTDAGQKRPNNEDYAMAYMPNDPLVLRTSGSLFIVADGVGGRTRGEETSRYATGQVLARFYEMDDLPPTDRLKVILREVGNELYSQSSGQPTGGATTLVAAAVLENQLTIANVGDSRAYLIHDGQAQQITRDHNQMSELLRLGALSVAEVENASGYNRLTRSLGGQLNVEVDIFSKIPLYPGDMLLLCSDGLTRYIDDEQIALLSGMGGPDQVCQLLVDWANKSGGEDNITVIVVEVQDGETASTRGGPLEGSSLGPEFLPISTGPTTGELRKRKPQPGANRLLVLILIIGALILLALMGWQVSGWLGAAKPTEQAAATGTPAESSILPAVVTPQPTPTAAVSLETPVVVAQQPSPSPTVRPGNTCIWTVEAGQSLFSIVRRFELTYSESDEYFYYETCDLEQAVCSGERAIIESHASIFAGWNIVIPEVDADTCEQGEGVWAQAGESAPE